MSNSPQDSIRQRLAAYLDGTLSERARTEFVARVGGESRLAGGITAAEEDRRVSRACLPPPCPAGRPFGPIAPGDGRQHDPLSGAATLGDDRRRGRSDDCVGVLGMAVFLACKPAAGLQSKTSLGNDLQNCALRVVSSRLGCARTITFSPRRFSNVRGKVCCWQRCHREAAWSDLPIVAASAGIRRRCWLASRASR